MMVWYMSVNCNYVQLNLDFDFISMDLYKIEE